MTEPIPFSMYSAPTLNCAEGPLLLLGEAPGEEEEKAGKPFIGASGQLLNNLLHIAGFKREQFHVTNVFAARPPGNDLKAWTLTKTDLKRAGYQECGRLPQINKRYLHPERECELQRLGVELAEIKPHLIIALGGTALWALSGDSRITQHRGNFFQPTYKNIDWPCTALATFHPAMVLRAWDNRPIVWADFLKARRWLDGTLPPPLKRKLWINPTPEEIADVYARFAGVPTALLGVDIETVPTSGQLTTFAVGSSEECICLPLWFPATLPAMCHANDSLAGEVASWQWIRRFCDLPNPKVMQNGMYDMTWLLDVMDIRPVNVLHDTAILQHALQPELPKALGTLASLYLHVPSWKGMRTSHKDDGKADE